MATPSTDLRQHVWIKHTLTPVMVLPNDAGEPIVFVDPDQQLMSEENAVYGCNACGQPLAHGLNTECEGPDEEG